MKNAAALLHRQNLGEKVFEILKEWILSGELKPGQRIVEVPLAKRLDVSRAPVREALQLLALRGFVTINPHRGAFVTHLSNDDVREIFAIREPLEVYAAKQVRAAMTGAKAERLEAALARLQDATLARDVIRFAEADFEFHRTLWELSGNRHLVKVLVDLTTRFFGYEQIRDAAHAREFRYDDMYEEHRRLVDLIIRGSEQQIEAQFRAAFTQFLEYVILRFDRQTGSHRPVE